MAKVLIAEDEENIREVVALKLASAKYEVTQVCNGQEAVERFKTEKPPFDIVILDIMMPVMDGLAACNQIRELSDRVGIIILSARSQEGDKLSGLSLGADDYIVKGSSLEEIKLRVDATYRRVESIKGKSETKKVHGFAVNGKSRSITKDGTPLDLTQVEYAILELFIANPETALSRGEILKSVWGEDTNNDEHAVDVNIRRLRMKIEKDPANPVHLATIRGTGYIWHE